LRFLVTGSSGLIGSEAVRYFASQGHKVYGIDNNLRMLFFGKDGDTTWVLERLKQDLPDFVHRHEDIRDRAAVLAALEEIRPDAIIHCAAQPSHDLAARMPFEDFDTNAVGTLNLLEATRRYAPQAPFVFMSTNKVYGDAPNRIALDELPTRWDYADPAYSAGIAESFPIDQSLHSLFGASKRRGRRSLPGVRTVLRNENGDLPGRLPRRREPLGRRAPRISRVLLQGRRGRRPYTIFGYLGKQVRDQIHSHDVVRAFERFIEAPRPGEVYNLGGGKGNSISILETLDRVQAILGVRVETTYSETARTGDHICYYSDLSKLKAHYPGWDVTLSIDDIFGSSQRPARGFGQAARGRLRLTRRPSSTSISAGPGHSRGRRAPASSRPGITSVFMTGSFAKYPFLPAGPAAPPGTALARCATWTPRRGSHTIDGTETATHESPARQRTDENSRGRDEWRA
jgi:CDP-paratose 2-epimerase